MSVFRAALLSALLLCPLLIRPTPTGAQTVGASTATDAVYADARPKLLQIRTLLRTAGAKSSTGSGFLVSADGLAITNYHVVSEYALEPQTYRLEYAAGDQGSGPVEIVALDIADDLALIRIDRRDQPFFRFDDVAVAGTMPKGERLYSLGDPLDLGFTIVEGTYNGLVDRSYTDRIHFTGAINPGMSGGPSVTAEGRIAGINVAKLMGNDLISFLVPARFAAELLARAGEGKPVAGAELKAEIGRQLSAWQSRFYGAIGKDGFTTTATGPYRAPESAAPWFSCGGQTNADRAPKPKTLIDGTNCFSDSRVFVAEGLTIGLVHLSHTYLRTSELNPMQFSALLTQQGRGGMSQQWPRKWFTRQACRDDFVAAPEGDDGPVRRVIWCARAYREFDDLYDVSVTLVTVDRDREALVSRLLLDGISFGNAMTLSQSFVDAVRWNR
jgi:S1-C subfamily serine protease